PVPTTERELDFERRHGVLVYPNGSPTVNRWSMGIIILLVDTCTGLFLFSYYYISLFHVAWPIGNIEQPGLLLPGIGTIGVLIAAAGMFWANRSIERGGLAGMRVGLLVAFLGGALAAGVLVYDL